MPLNLRRALMVVAIVLFAVFALVSLGTVTTGHPFAWLGFGLVALAGALFP